MSQTAYPGVNNLTEEKLQVKIKMALDPASRHNLAQLQPGAYAALPGGKAAVNEERGCFTYKTRKEHFCPQMNAAFEERLPRLCCAGPATLWLLGQLSAHGFSYYSVSEAKRENVLVSHSAFETELNLFDPSANKVFLKSRQI